MTEHTTDATGDEIERREPSAPTEGTAAPGGEAPVAGEASDRVPSPELDVPDAAVPHDAVATDDDVTDHAVATDDDAADVLVPDGAQARAAGLVPTTTDAPGAPDAAGLHHPQPAATPVEDASPVEDADSDAPTGDAPEAQAPATDVPAADVPVGDAPLAGSPAADGSPAEQPALEQPAPEQPAPEQPAADQPAADQPVSDQPAADQPALEQPGAAGDPVTDAPASDAPTGDSPADVTQEDLASEAGAADTPAAEVEGGADSATAPPAEAQPGSPPAAEADAAPGTTATPAPAPGPSPRPTPRPVPRPMPRAPQAPATATGAPVAPVAPPQDAAEAAHAATFGRVDEENTVYVREAAGERAVGQFPGATPEEALALYVRRYLDLHAKVVLFEARLGSADLPVKEVDQTLAKLTEELADPAAVGDLDGLRGRLDALRSVAAERRAAAEAERAAAKEAAVAARTAIVEQAEKIAGTDPERIQWRPAGEQLRQLLDQWKDAQRNGPRIDRPTEESLWKRFSHARTTFDRERRHFFAELESRNASARAAKEALVAQAEKLSSSTDWGATAGAYRDLMAQWKASGRASRKEDDALWARFRAAQDAFFAARDAASAETDAEFRVNLEVKERLLVEAEKLLPIRDLAATKAALRSVQERWDAAGKVPRGDLQRVEGRLRAVESAVRDADQSAWTRGNPETRARAEGAAAQLEAAIAGLEADLAAAQSAGDARRIADAQTALDARRAWLEQVRRAAQGA